MHFLFEVFLWGTRSGTGFSCGVRRSLREEGGHFCLSTDRHCMAGPGLPVQGRRGNVPTDPLGYSKAQNTALISHVDSLLNHSWWTFQTTAWS